MSKDYKDPHDARVKKLYEDGVLIDCKAAGPVLGVSGHNAHAVMKRHGYNAIPYTPGHGGTRRSLYRQKDVKRVAEFLETKRREKITRPLKKTGKSMKDFNPPDVDGWAKNEEHAHKGFIRTMKDAQIEDDIIKYLLTLAEQRAFRWEPSLEPREGIPRIVSDI